MKCLKIGFMAATAVLMILSLLALPSYAQAQDSSSVPTYAGQTYATQQSEDRWGFTITPFAWFIGITGDVTVKDRTTHVSVPFSDIWDNLDFGGELQFEARKGRWGIFLQPNYIKFSPTGSLTRPAAIDIANGGPAIREVDVRVTSETFFTEFGGFYRIWECPPSSSNKQGYGSIDVMAGGRYWYLQNHIALNLPERGVSFRETSYADIIDPLIGFRMQVYVAPKVSISLRGDAGGFGISSDSSHVTWNGVGTIGFDISPCATLLAGYRYLYINYGPNGGAKAKLTLQGPGIGLGYKF